MEYLFIQRERDKAEIFKLYNEFKLLSKLDLVHRYNTTVAIGIVGAHAQGQMLVALYHAFNFAFGNSPINIEENIIISLTGKIQLNDANWIYEK
ncbi:hypothetical protein [Flavobacterium sp.]|jgi:hypothetical protein|uniref:hypothetical protein n=1 Tax=Flavobacterium sp. TaxID=239 RepID=UPI0037C0E7F9